MSDIDVLTRRPKLAPPKEQKKGSSPHKWAVFVSSKKYFCPNLLSKVLTEVFDFEDLTILIIYMILRKGLHDASVTNAITRDLAETLAEKGNKFVEPEQTGCLCQSSIAFNARQLPEGF